MQASYVEYLKSYYWLACTIVILFFSPVYAQSLQPKLSFVQTGDRTVMMLPGNWTASTTEAHVTLYPSSQVEKVAAPEWWNITVKNNQIRFQLAGNTSDSSTFLIWTNSTNVRYKYDIMINDTKYSDKIISKESTDHVFSKWIDPKERAMSAFIPDGWSADLQIIRPYESMTGYVFFTRGPDNTLAYIFQPFMPLHILPDNSLCKLDLCPGTISADKVREIGIGNAPIVVSELKSPTEYFASEVLPLLKKNLHSYKIESQQSVYALAYGTNETTMMPSHQVEYSFYVEDKRIKGKAMVFVGNHTMDNTGIWNGVIVGIESEEQNFDSAFQQATVTLLTVGFDNNWIESEKKAMIANANSGLAISELMANRTISDFGIIVPTVAHKLVRTYNNTMIAGYLDTRTGEEIHLPLFPDLQYWFLEGDQLIGRKASRNTLNSTSLEPLF